MTLTYCWLSNVQYWSAVQNKQNSCGVHVSEVSYIYSYLSQCTKLMCAVQCLGRAGVGTHTAGAVLRDAVQCKVKQNSG